MCIDIVYSTFLDKVFLFFLRSGYYIPTSNTPCHMYALLSINQTIIRKFRRVTYHLVRTPIVVFTPCASNHTVRGFFLSFRLSYIPHVEYPWHVIPAASFTNSGSNPKKEKERKKKKKRRRMVPPVTQTRLYWSARISGHKILGMTYMMSVRTDWRADLEGHCIRVPVCGLGHFRGDHFSEFLFYFRKARNLGAFVIFGKWTFSETCL